MKFIKRILALVPAVLVLLFSVVPLSSAAEVDLNPDSAGFLSDQFADFEDFSPYYSVENPSTYIIYKSYESISSSKYNPWYRAVTHFIDLSDAEYSYVDGVYYWDFSNYSRNLVEWEGEYRYNTESGSLSEYSQYIQKHAAYSVTLDTNKHEFYVNDHKFPNLYFNIHPGNYLHFDLSYVIDGFKPGSLNEIEVNTFPKLEGDTTLNIYQLDDEGYKVKDSANTYLSLQTFQIDITNNSDKSFQFVCYIMPKGESLTYHSNYSEILGSRFFSNNPTFIYITDEIFYNYLGNDNPTSPVYNNQYRTVYAPSSWHLIEAGASESVYIGENQLQLKKDIEYDIVILGVFTEYGEIIEGTLNNGSSSLNSIVTGIDPYVTFYSDYEVKEYYRSTFTLDKDTSYCNTQYSDDGSFDMLNTHVYPYNPNTSNDEVFNTIYGQTFEGETSYHNNVFNPNYNGAHVDYPGSNPGINNNFGSGVSLTSGFNSFFGMITDLLKHLPGPFLSIFIFGFSSIVVIAIIKAVKS